MEINFTENKPTIFSSKCIWDKWQPLKSTICRLKRIAQIEGKRDLDTGILRKNIPIGIMCDAQFSIQVPVLTDIGAHAHKILESESLTSIISIDDRLRDIRWTG